MKIITSRDDVASLGDNIKYKGHIRKVIGYAIGDDGKDCYVCSHCATDKGWQTYLVPVDSIESIWVEHKIGEQ